MDNIEIDVGKLNREKFNLMFGGWHAYADAPTETIKFLDEIACLTTYANHETTVSYEIRFPTKSGKRGRCVGALVIALHDVVDRVHIRIHPYSKFSSAGGGEKALEFVRLAIGKWNELKQTFQQYGLVD